MYESIVFILQHAKRMRCIIFSCMTVSLYNIFRALSHKLHDFGGVGRGGILVNVKCVLFSSETLVGIISNSENNSVRSCRKCVGPVVQSVKRLTTD